MKFQPEALALQALSTPNKPWGVVGGATPKCRYAAKVATRPRGVRCKYPC